MIKIGSHVVGGGAPPLFIAEIGANHNGDMALAERLIDSARAAGCEIAKFQSWSKESLFSRAVYDQNNFPSDNGETLEQTVEKLSVNQEQFRALAAYCDKVGIMFGCTPFSRPEVDFLVDDLKVRFLKIASMDCNNYPFLDYVARKGLPVILSTGLAALHEIDRAVETFERAGNRDLVLLHCVAQYPPDVDALNLNNIEGLQETYPDYPVGFSDHTIGVAAPLAAIAKGACLIEKHFTLDKNLPGWDHRVSADGPDMTALVEQGRMIARALGSRRRRVTEADLASRKNFRRSAVAARFLPAGTRLQSEDIDFKRPGVGLPPETLESLIGRTVKTDVALDAMITWEILG